ncbi:MAG: hydratase, partial [Firmicutes bacterium]|nr:hydratase [Bacillota bacterium]
LLKKTYDINYPAVIAVRLTGTPMPGVGPHDVAIALIKEVFASGFVKNKVLEFIGDGIEGLSVDFRNGIDVMTTETTCLSSVWMTDEKVKAYYKTHNREQDYKELRPGDIACYDGLVTVDLSQVRPMIALPFHPSNAYTIEEFNKNADELLAAVERETDKQYGKNGIKSNLRSKIRDGRLQTDQGVIAGCAGGIFDNIMAVADILRGKSTGSGEFALNVYPASQSVYYELIANGGAAELMASGAVLKTAFCGPCFGAGDVPAHNAFSIRHTTRNFPNREGSKPGDGQISYCALMDARSIAATAANGGRLTAATELEVDYKEYPYTYHDELYKRRVYNGWGRPQPQQELIMGPNIANWPEMPQMPDNLVLRMCSVIRDKVTTTDELIPSGETSTLRSNPYKLSEFTLSRKDPEYVQRAKNVRGQERRRAAGEQPDEEYSALLSAFDGNVSIGSAVFANMPGDGSAREQAASCQKVLGGWANIALEYATKRYRSNLINWGLVPLHISADEAMLLRQDDFVVLPGIKQAILNKTDTVEGFIVRGEKRIPLHLWIQPMTDDERDILTSGGLINYYAGQN